MVEQSAQPQTIIDKVQQPFNHTRPVVEMELTIKIRNLARHNNKLEARPKANHQETPKSHLELQAVKRLIPMELHSQPLRQKQLALLQSAIIF
jgi:hypothetical protein